MEVSVQTVDCRIPTGMEIYINEMKNNGGVCVDCRIPTGMKGKMINERICSKKKDKNG